MKPSIRSARSQITNALVAAWLGLGCVASHAAPLTIAETPLLVSTTVQPNVMLLIDNSGSMDNIIWATGYDDNVAHPQWERCTERSSSACSSWSTMTTAQGNITLTSINRGACSTGYQQFRRLGGTTTKCLLLPDPVGGSITRYTGNYLNYLLETYANSNNTNNEIINLTGGQIPTEYRMQVARDVANSLVENTPGMRFGVSRFYGPQSENYGHGALIDATCGSTVNELQLAISGYTSQTNTPLAEALYEITRYYRGLDSYYHSSSSTCNANVPCRPYVSPIQYRCQKNFTIVLTDGLPTRDTNFPTNDPADVADTARDLPDWDGLHPATTAGDYPDFPQYSDGFDPAGTGAAEGSSLYLDDIAKFAWDIDMKTSGNDTAGGSYQDLRFPTQNMYTYAIGFSTGNQMLADTAEYGHGLYMLADNAQQLTQALQIAMNNVFAMSSSSSSVAANSTRLNTDTKIYQARFNSLQWSGELLAFPINSDGSVGTMASNAANNMPEHGDRNIYAYHPTAIPRGVPFTWSGGSTQLSATQQTALNTNISGVNDGLGPNRVSYLRGNRSLEAQNGGSFRNRASTLGDIVNSDPHFIGTPDYRYDLLPSTEGAAYRTFRDSAAYRNRTPMLYVGANDGMLHAFDADTLTERFAFVPNAVFPKLSALTETNYNHTFFVDGSPRSGDAYIGGAWKTVLVSGLRSGGKSIFALDVTNPAGFTGSNVLWEFTDATNLGYTFSQPTIVRLGNGQWAAIFGNGYNSTAQTAQLFIVNLADGSLISRIDTGVGSATVAGNPNGLSTPVPVDVDGDRITDYVYAGDLYGNMWKFDLTPNNVSNWNVAYRQGGTNYPLYRAVDANGNGQPITVRPEIGRHPASGTNGGLMVYFGTGKYLETGDNTVPANAPRQTFYGIRDNGTRVSNGISDLQQQTITETLNDDGRLVRIVSETAVAATMRGWYVNLPTNGERSISNPVLHSGRIIFTTLIPDADPCSFGGVSWLMELNAVTGARFAYPVFDLNGDGVINDQDRLEDDTPTSGQLYDGVIPTPTILDAGELQYKYMSSSSGTVEVLTELGDDQAARQSWRQIR